MGVGERGGRPRLATLGVVTGYGLVASVFTTIVTVRLRGMRETGMGLRLGCVLCTIGMLVLVVTVAAAIRHARRTRGARRREGG